MLKSRFGARSMPDPRRFRTELAKTLALACPIIAGQVGQMLMGLVDTLMVGHVGTSSLAAAAFANSLMSVAFVFGIGVLTSVGVLVSRAHGAGMVQHQRVILRSSIWLSAMVGVTLAIALTLAQPCLSVFRQAEAVLAQAKPFIAILSWSLVPALIFISSKTFCEALSRPSVPAQIMYLGVALNVFLNWVFIFGNLGAPALGLVGAGWATLVARIVTMAGTLLFCLRVTGSGFSVLWPGSLHSPTLRALLRLGLPVGLQYLCEVGACSAPDRDFLRGNDIHVPARNRPGGRLANWPSGRRRERRIGTDDRFRRTVSLWSDHAVFRARLCHARTLDRERL